MHRSKLGCDVKRNYRGPRQFPPMCGFQLDEVDSSSGESDGDNEPGTFRSNQKVKLKDSLDLSMSELMDEKVFPLQPVESKNQLMMPILNSESVNLATSARKLGDEKGVKDFPEITTTEEERQLMRSLEKLDHRLATVSGPQSSEVREGAALLSGKSRTKGLVSSSVEDGEETLRMANGGRGRSKLRQPALIPVRSALRKRVDQPTGVHKTRVRVGGAVIYDPAHNTSGSGKHKILVKKDLAHLLF